jgi:hypothetical protein
MRQTTLAAASLSLLGIVSGCAGETEPTTADSTTPDRIATTAVDGGPGAEPSPAPVREITLGCDSRELTDALTPVLAESGFDLDLDESDRGQLACVWAGDSDGRIGLTLNITAVGSVESPEPGPEDLRGGRWNRLDDRRVEALGARARGRVTELTFRGLSVVIYTVIVTNDIYEVKLSTTAKLEDLDEPVGFAIALTGGELRLEKSAIQVAEVVFGS